MSRLKRFFGTYARPVKISLCVILVLAVVGAVVGYFIGSVTFGLAMGAALGVCAVLLQPPAPRPINPDAERDARTKSADISGFGGGGGF